MTRAVVGLVQINNSFFNSCYLPYSVGLLQAYFQKYSKQAADFAFCDPIYRRLPVKEAVRHLQSAAIVGFSVYVWNFKISLAIAEELKRLKPETIIIFGGVHVPERPEQTEQFLRNHLYVDVVCHGEGEEVFLQLLENAHSRSWHRVQSISYLDRGRFVRNPGATRISDISVIPSPYLTGVFDNLMEKETSHEWLGLWETNRGCPFSCAYCQWGTASHTRLLTFDLDRLRQEVEWFASHSVEFIFCCDANFGLLPRDIEIAGFVAEAKERTGYPKALSVQNTKNATERSYLLQTVLSKAGLSKGVNLALQTVDETALGNIGRSNISLSSFHELQRRFNHDHVDTFTDIILALPGETYDSFTHGVNEIIENGQHHRIQFINLAILPNAPMADPEYQEQHSLVTIENRIINIHGSLIDTGDGIHETQELVISTATMPPEDWARARAFAWMISLLYFDKLLQIPFVLLHELCGCSYSRLVQWFMVERQAKYPVVSEIVAFFKAQATSIQNGGPEYYHSEEWLNMYWPHDEYVLIRLVHEDKLDAFYTESEAMIGELLENLGEIVPPFLKESIFLNKELVKRPLQDKDAKVDLDYNVYEFYRAVLLGEKVPLESKAITYHIDRTTEKWSSWDDWCREVIWYGNKRGAYLYGIR